MEFERIPELLHGTNPAFTPPFPGSVAKFLRPESLFHRQDGTITAFLAHRNGKPVGRIAAIHNRSYSKHSNDQAGFFGFFACEDDVQTAKALFDKAAEVLIAAGCDRMIGPYEPTIHEQCGLLVEGVEFPPHISMPWNPLYYGRLLAESGCVADRTLFAYHLDLTVDVPERIQKIARRIKERSPDVTIRSFRMSELDDELRLTHKLYNITLDRNGGFYPITVDDLLASADDLRAFADPEFLTFGEVNGEPVAFMLTLPNFNEILFRTKRLPRFLRLPCIALMMKFHRYHSVRQAVLGIAHGHRERGLAALMCYDMVQRTKVRAKSAELSWIESNNREVITLIEAMGGKREKTYQLFTKAL